MTPPSVALTGKTALVTGAASGLGEAIVRLFAACGARIGAVDRDRRALHRVVNRINATGGSVLALPADVSNPKQMRQAVARLERSWKRLDILCANAGINGVRAPVDDLTPEEWDETIAVNLRGTFLTVREGARIMKQNGGGSIIIISSVVGTRMFSQSGATAYAASKAGQLAFGRQIALELAKDRIRVNTICPGVFASNIMNKTRARQTDHLHLPVIFPEGGVPLTGGKPATAEQIARVAWYLASGLSDHVTGTEIYADGGQSLLMG